MTSLRHGLGIAALFTIVGLAPSAEAAKYNWQGCASPGITCSSSPVTSSSDNRVQHPEIVPIFWQDCQGCNGAGLQWDANPVVEANTFGSLLEVIEGAWAAALSQYGGTGQISRPRVSPYAPRYTGAPPGSSHTTANATMDDILALVGDMISKNQVPAPYVGQTDDVIYLVFTPTTAVSYCGSNGCNDYRPGAYHGVDLLIGQVNQGYDPSPTSTFTHEIAEAITNWQGISLANCTDGGGEIQIGDMCNQCSESQDGVIVQSYWSEADQACVVPESWGVLREATSSAGGFGAPPGWFPMRQASGGGGGVVATDTKGLMYFYSQSSGRWLGHRTCLTGFPCWAADPFGPVGAAVAAGGTGNSAFVATIPENTSAGVKTYALSQGTSGTWNKLGTPNGPLVTSVNVTSNGTVVATDRYANLWYWTGSAWSLIGGTESPYGFDDVATSGNNVLVTDHNRTTLYAWSSATHAWTTAMVAPGTNHYTHIVASPDAPDYGVVLAGSAGFQTNVSLPVVNAFEFAATGDATTTFTGTVDWTSRSVLGCSGSGCAFVWNQLPGGALTAGRLISGAEMYISGCTASGCYFY